MSASGTFRTLPAGAGMSAVEGEADECRAVFDCSQWPQKKRKRIPPFAGDAAFSLGCGTCSRRHHPVICPVGWFVDRRVESYFCFSEKYFGSHLPQIRSRTFRVPPHQRGVSRSSRTRDGMRWTRQRFARDGIAGRVGERPVSDQQRADERCSSRTAKSCGPDAPTLASSSRS